MILKLRSNVRIDKLNESHAPKMYQWIQQPSVRDNIGLRHEPTLKKTTDWIREASNNDEIFAFAIMFGDNHVGNVILDKVDQYLKMARFSIYIGEGEKRGSGIGRTAAFKVCEFGFDNLLLNKVWLTVHSKNFAAINSYSLLGFRLEGILRDEFLLDAQRLDSFYMGILKSGFRQLMVNFE